MLRRLYHDQDFRKRLGENAAETARKYAWERNGHGFRRHRAAQGAGGHTNSDAGIMRSGATNNPRSNCLSRRAFLCR